MAKDPRYKSGEHHYGPDDEDSTKESLDQLSTIGAVGAEIRSLRRETKLQFQHFGARFDDALTSIRDITQSHQAVSQEHAAHLVRIKGLENRVKTLETEDRKAPGSESGTSWMKIAAKNPAIPWAVAGLLALAMILAAITGRGVNTIVPSAKDPPASTGATINVNAKE